jgi:hypothetical protein
MAGSVRGGLRIERKGRPDLRAHREVESLRRNTNDFVRLTIERDGLADDGAIAAEAALPHPITDHRAVILARGFLVARECSPEGRLHAQRREQIGGYVEALDSLRFVAPDDVDVPPLHGSEPLDRSCLRLPVEEIRG